MRWRNASATGSAVAPALRAGGPQGVLRLAEAVKKFGSSSVNGSSRGDPAGRPNGSTDGNCGARATHRVAPTKTVWETAIAFFHSIAGPWPHSRFLYSAVLVAACWLALSGRSFSPPANTPPNIILIAVDTLRADRLECYGYSGVKTPNINRLAQDGVLFREAIAQVPLTLPSFCSIMTGTYPMLHGVRDFSYGSLGKEQTTLAELLKSKGYATAAFIGAFVLDARFGLDQGFDHYTGRFDLGRYQGIDPGMIQHRGDKVVSEVLDWMEAKRQEPFFAWIHLYDPHHPFEAPEPFRSQYSKSPYDGEVAYVDSLVGEIVVDLRKRGLYDDSLIVFTSDHGESLGEHQEANHGFFIYDASLKIPLIIKAPAGEPRGKIVEAQVRSVDIAPTILQYTSVGKPGVMQGVGLRSLIEGKAARIAEPHAYSESYYSHSSFGWSPLRSLRTFKYKYILAPQPELYDLESDPGELKNIYAENQTIGHRLQEELLRVEERYSRKEKGEDRVDLDPAVIESLKSLGYVAFAEGGRKNTALDISALPDPKEKIDQFNLYLEAQDLVQLGKTEAAMERLKRLVKLDPHITIAIHTLTNRYLMMGKHQEALEMNQDVLNQNPASEAAAFNLGRIYNQLRQPDEAIRFYLKALAINPESAATYHNLGTAYIRKKEFTKAVEVLETATQLKPHLADAHVNLGLAHFLNGNFDQAIQSLKRGIELDPDDPRPHNYLGNVYLKMGRRSEGEAELRLAKEKASRK